MKNFVFNFEEFPAAGGSNRGSFSLLRREGLARRPTGKVKFFKI
jgi:hypothetical protein